MYLMALTSTELPFSEIAVLSLSDRQLLHREALSPCVNGPGGLKMWISGVLRATRSQQTGRKPIWTLCWGDRKVFGMPKVN